MESDATRVGRWRGTAYTAASIGGRRSDLIKFHHAIIAFRETAEEHHQFHQSDHERPGLATSPAHSHPFPFHFLT
jgi:hypothetical protein